MRCGAAVKAGSRQLASKTGSQAAQVRRQAFQKCAKTGCHKESAPCQALLFVYARN